jgi:hypothetical protein
MFRIFWLALLLPCVLSAQEMACYHVDQRGATRALEIDQKVLLADIVPDTLTQSVEGVVQIGFSPLRQGLSTIFMDGPNMSFKSVLLDGQPVGFTPSDSGIHIQVSNLVPGTDYEIEMAYTAKPKKGLYFLGWNGPENARRQIWSQGQGIDHRHWIPHVDAQNDKLKTALIVTFDSKYEVICNGQLAAKKENANGLSTWSYQFVGPHASYLMMLAIGKFEKQVLATDNQKGPEIVNYFYPDRPEAVEFTFRRTREILNFLERETGVPYPWGNTYVQVPVKDFLYGGMENTGATIFHDAFFIPEAHASDLGYFRVNIHELAHQWFGNLVTAYGGRDHWLHEGFATYYEFLAEAEILGIEVADQERLKALERVLEGTFTKPIAHADAGSLSHYQKAALVLHMIRVKLGPEDFRRAVNQYLRRFMGESVNSMDFEMALHRTTGYVFHEFFNQWVHQPELPELQVRSEVTAEGRGRKKRNHIRIELSQFAPSGVIFELPIQIALRREGIQIDTLIILKEESKTIEWNVPFSKDKMVVFADPNRDLLADVRQQWVLVDFPNLWKLAETAPTKWQLLRDFSRFQGDDQFEETARKLLAMEHTPSIKADLYSLLFSHMSKVNEESWEIPSWALQDLQDTKDPKLAMALLKSNGQIPEEALLEVLYGFLDMQNLDVWENVLYALLMQSGTGLEHALALTEPAANRNYGTFPVSWQFLSMVTGNREALPVFLGYLSEAADADQRQYAIEILNSSRWINEQVVGEVIKAATYFNSRLSRAAKTYLQQMYQFPQASELIDKWIVEHEEDAESRAALYLKLGIKSGEDAD